MAQFNISPAMPGRSLSGWPGSIWIGEIDIDDDVSGGIHLEASSDDSRARLLVRSGRRPLGFIELPVFNEQIAAADAQRAILELPRPTAPPAPAALPPISVVLCTRDRPEALRSAIDSLLRLDYPAYEIVIVDNASSTDASEVVVTSFADPRLRLISEPMPGLARARNSGVLEARNEVVAFTDDDVVVDRHWLRGIADGFGLAPDVACVCGIVPTGELRSYSQAYFDGRVSWASSCEPRVYRLNEPPAGSNLFPFQVGQFGTGANFAMRKAFLVHLGGFDEALGVGSPTKSGEDIDMFVRVLLAGSALAYHPSALVWHRHRIDMASLQKQIEGYGLGLGAWIGKLLTNPRTAAMVIRRALRGLQHARKMTSVHIPGAEPSVSGPRGSGLAAIELRAIAKGPVSYLRARLAGAKKRPLTNP